MKKKRLILIALFILALIGISFYGGAVTYVFLWTVIAVPVILWFYIFMVISNLRIYQKPDGRNMVCGRPSGFYITLQNESFFSFSSLRIKFYSSFSEISDMREDVVYELPPHSRIQKKTGLLCKYRGQYDVGVKQICVTDFLGVFSFTYNIKEPLNVIVAPARLSLFEHFTEGEMPDADSENRAYRSIPDIPVREYMAGDDIRFANWKASAAAGKLMVRELTGEERSGIALIMDPKRYGSDTFEYLPSENKATECVLGLALYYLEHNIPVDVYLQESEKTVSKLAASGDYEYLYGKLTAYAFNEERDMKQLLSASPELSEYRMLICVMEKWDAETLAMIESLNTVGVPVKIYLIDDTGFDNTDVVSGDTMLIPVGCNTVIGEGLI
ncbi:MAG: DUF58 domain-containing protein [Lachnospiraceae bacterium]|nr:DUF58 domain-containing protein [Lachnospiraceae bacterium]